MTRQVDPLDRSAPIVDPKTGTPSPFLMRQWQNLLALVQSIVVNDASIAALRNRNINTTAPLAGGGNLTADRTLSLNDTAVTPATYGDSSHVGQFTVDQKGRLTAAASVAIPAANIQTLLDGIANVQGDVLYRGASAWAALAPGTSGQFLKTLGASANPVWAAQSATAPSPNTGTVETWTTAGNGETHTVADTTNFFIRTDTTGRTTVTIKLPAAPTNGQFVIMLFAGSFSSPTFNGNGATLVGTAPTQLLATTMMVFVYVSATTTWHYIQKL